MGLVTMSKEVSDVAGKMACFIGGRVWHTGGVKPLLMGEMVYWAILEPIYWLQHTSVVRYQAM